MAAADSSRALRKRWLRSMSAMRPLKRSAMPLVCGVRGVMRRYSMPCYRQARPKGRMLVGTRSPQRTKRSMNFLLLSVRIRRTGPGAPVQVRKECLSRAAARRADQHPEGAGDPQAGCRRRLSPLPSLFDPRNMARIACDPLGQQRGARSAPSEAAAVSPHGAWGPFTLGHTDVLSRHRKRHSCQVPPHDFGHGHDRGSGREAFRPDHSVCVHARTGRHSCFVPVSRVSYRSRGTCHRRRSSLAS